MIPYEFSVERFSRWMAYVLRHNPERYGLQADRHGYVDFEEFLRVAARRYPALAADRLRELICSAGPARFDVGDGRIRARYGHTFAAAPIGSPVEPPEQLYHGAEEGLAPRLLADGLTPVDRTMLHLSDTVDDAVAVASKRGGRVAVIRIQAREAQAAGVAFYRESKVYLAAQIPARFLSLEPLPVDAGPAAAPAEPPDAPTAS